MNIVISMEDALLLSRGIHDIDDKEFYKIQEDFLGVKGRLIEKYGRKVYNSIINKIIEYDFDIV